MFHDTRGLHPQGELDELSDVFAAASRFVESDEAKHQAEFADVYDTATDGMSATL